MRQMPEVTRPPDRCLRCVSSRVRVAHPPAANAGRRIFDGQAPGAAIQGDDTKGRLEGCEVSANKEFNVLIDAGANPTLFECK